MAYARGKYAKAISDRSGMEFPYNEMVKDCLLYTSPSPRDRFLSRMPSSA